MTASRQRPAPDAHLTQLRDSSFAARYWAWAICVAVLAAASCTRAQLHPRCLLNAVSWPRKHLPLNLVEDLNNDGIVSAAAPADGNFDMPARPEATVGNAYPGELVPRAGAWLKLEGCPDAQFLFPGKQPGVPNNFSCEGQRFKLPPGHYRAAFVLGAGDRPDQQALCTFYYEGKRQEETLALPNWLAPKPQTGGPASLVLPYHYSAEGQATKRKYEPCALWAKRFELDSTLPLRGLKFDYSTHVHVFAITLVCQDWSAEHSEYLSDTHKSYALLRGPVRAAFDGFVREAAELRSELAALPEGVQSRLPRQTQWVATEVDFVESLFPEKRIQLTAEETADSEDAIARARHDLRAIAKGRDPFAGRREIVLKSYHSVLDDTRQPYSLFVPKAYNGRKPWPLVVDLHGHGWYRPFQGYPPEEIEGAIVLSPHGRGSIDYMLASEDDVLRCIEDVKKDYNVDPDRVCLTGRSMGGTGTWNLGVKFPDVFAALAPVAANADSRVWERLWKWPCPDDSPVIGKVKAAVAYSANPVEYADNLLNLPVFCVHGSDDRVVPVDHSRSMVQRVWQLPGRYYFNYQEPQWTSHGAVSDDLLDEQTLWLLEQKRVARPKRVHLKAMKLRYGKAYWLKLEALEAPLKYANASAEADESGKVEIEVQHVTALTLDLAASPAHKAGTLDVNVNAAPAFQGPCPAAGKLTLTRGADGKWQAGALPKGLVKKAGLEGPIEDAFLSPFVLVYGTGGPSAADRLVAKSEAERCAADWERLFGKPCRIEPDRAIDAAAIQQLHLVLYGGPESNCVTARVMRETLPVAVEAGRVRVGDKTYAGDDVGVKLCYPNPLNPERYVVVFAGTTWRGLYQIVNRFGNWFHWGPFDNRNWFDYGVFDDRTRSPETFLCFGFFDAQWRIDPESQWPGQESARQASRPRRMPQYASVAELPATSPDQQGSTRQRLYLSDLVPALIDQHKGVVNSDRSFQGNGLCVGRKAAAKGLGVRAPSEVTFEIDGRFQRFEAEAGVDLEGAEELTRVRKKMEWIQFEVYGDDKRLYRSDWLQGDSPACRISVPIAGVRELRLQVNGSSARWLIGSAAWGGARLEGGGW